MSQYITIKSENSPLQKSISKLIKLFFHYDNDVITFEFAALDYSAPEKISMRIS